MKAAPTERKAFRICVFYKRTAPSGVEGRVDLEFRIGNERLGLLIMQVWFFLLGFFFFCLDTKETKNQGCQALT